MTITPPNAISQLSQRIVTNNFVALQSAKLAVTNASASITFTNLPGNQPVTMKICNTGAKAAYLCGSNSAAIVAAVASSSTPSPAAGALVASNADCIPAGAILNQDYITGTDTLSAICGGSDTTTLEISLGYGQ